jgi:hypothetical protein
METIYQDIDLQPVGTVTDPSHMSTWKTRFSRSKSKATHSLQKEEVKSNLLRAMEAETSKLQPASTVTYKLGF